MPSPTTSLTLVTDAAQAKAGLAGLIERDPAALSVVASVADGLIADPTRYAGPRWWLGRDPAGEVVAAFMHTPPHLLHVAVATEETARALAARLATEGDRLPGVGGQRRPAQAFAAEWGARTGVGSRVTMEIGSFDLPVAPRVPFEVSGRHRRAESADRELVDTWNRAFVRAIEGGGRTPPSLDHAVAGGRVALWEDDGRPVSMAYASRANGGITRISGVWTPPELRGHGYASGVVAALSRERQAAGERCMLYTDLANPTSNAIYVAMGYRRVGDAVNIAFSA